jgi:hypothetical protein
VGKTSQLLTLEASFGGGFTDDPLSDSGAVGGSTALSGGATRTNAGEVAVDYSLARQKMGVIAENHFYFDYYPQQAQYKLLSREGFVGSVYFLPSDRTRISINQTFKDLPQFSFGDLFATGGEGTPVPPSQDVGMSLTRYRRFGDELDISQKLNSRTRLFASASYARGMVQNGAQWSILIWTAEDSQAVAKGIHLDLNYQDGGQRALNTAEPAQWDRHPRLNGGIDFQRALSISRRTTVSFTTGVAGTHDHADKSTTYHLIGSAQVKRELGRTWIVGLGYSRDAQYIESLNIPLFNDGVAVSVKGTFSRRLQLSSSIGESTGHLGTSEATGLSQFNSYFGSTVLSFALSRMVGLSGDYSRYRYSVAGESFLPASLIHRQTFHFNVQLWLPLLNHRKA